MPKVQTKRHIFGRTAMRLRPPGLAWQWCECVCPVCGCPDGTDDALTPPTTLMMAGRFASRIAPKNTLGQNFRFLCCIVPVVPLSTSCGNIFERHRSRFIYVGQSSHAVKAACSLDANGKQHRNLMYLCTLAECIVYVLI